MITNIGQEKKNSKKIKKIKNIYLKNLQKI